MTVATWVCCSITSATHTRYALRGCCQGRSWRPCAACQRSRRVEKAVAPKRDSYCDGGGDSVFGCSAGAGCDGAGCAGAGCAGAASPDAGAVPGAGAGAGFGASFLLRKSLSLLLAFSLTFFSSFLSSSLALPFSAPPTSTLTLGAYQLPLTLIGSFR